MRLGSFGGGSFGDSFLPYWQVARRSFQRYATYRGATAAGVFTNTLFGFMKVAVLLAVYRQAAGPGGRIGAFDETDVVTFTFVSQGLLTTMGAYVGMQLAERIRSGDVVADLYRPLHFPGYWLAHDLGRAGYQLLARGLPPVLIGALVFTYRLPPDGRAAAAFALSLGLAALVSFAIRYLVILSGFWVVDVRGPWSLTGFVLMFFAGLIVPLNFFPAWLDRLARMTPFPALVQTPIEIFLGKAPGGAAAALAYQAVWAAALLALAERVTRRAFRKVVVHGG